MDITFYFMFLIFPVAYIYCMLKQRERELKMKEWFYDEFKQVGINFESEDEVKLYDEKYRASRDFEAEANYISSSISLRPEHTVLEIGSGTAEISLRLAERCRKVIAADISGTMLSYAKKKAAERGINNIEFIHSGFLNIKLEPESVDSVISQIALHHLPDFWKSVAIINVSKVLKPGGKFLLTDSVMSFDVNSYDEEITEQIDQLRSLATDKIVNEFIINIKNEYPTYSWVIEKMLKDTGFEIDRIDRHNALISTFVCTKLPL